MKATIYANYGVLAAEKRCVYTFPGSAEIAGVSERLDVIIPDKFAPRETEDGNVVLTIDGYEYLLSDVLCGNEHPCIVIPGPSERYECLARA